MNKASHDKMVKTWGELKLMDEEILRKREEEKRQQQISSGLTVDEWRQVFADAQAVKKQALENAKRALEEAFSSRFEQMFIERLANE